MERFDKHKQLSFTLKYLTDIFKKVEEIDISSSVILSIKREEILGMIEEKRNFLIELFGGKQLDNKNDKCKCGHLLKYHSFELKANGEYANKGCNKCKCKQFIPHDLITITL